MHEAAHSANGKMNTMTNDAKRRWNKLSDQDLAKMKGNAQEMIATLQERYGYTRERAQREVMQFLNQYDAKVYGFMQSLPGDVPSRIMRRPWASLATAVGLGLALGFLVRPGCDDTKHVTVDIGTDNPANWKSQLTQHGRALAGRAARNTRGAMARPYLAHPYNSWSQYNQSPRKVETVNDDIMQGKWKQLRGDIRKRWGQLTDNDLDQIEGEARSWPAFCKSAMATPKRKPDARSTSSLPMRARAASAAAQVAAMAVAAAAACATTTTSVLAEPHSSAAVRLSYTFINDHWSLLPNARSIS